MIPATVIIVTHNSAAHLGATLAALLADPDPPAEVVVVDNASVDETLAVARRHDVRVLGRTANDGFAGGCSAGAAVATHQRLVFLNPDAVPSAGWLRVLLAGLDEPDVGAAMATIELADRPGHFNTSGGAMTFAGTAWATDVGMPIPEVEPPLIEVPFPSGAAMAVRRAVWERLGGMRSDFFLYVEDADFGWRLHLCGLRTVRVTESRVTHAYDFDRHRGKLRLIERNRRLMVAANYRRSTRVLLAPALAAVDVGILLLAIRDGWWRDKLGAHRDAWRMRRSNATWRAGVQQRRKVGDASIISASERDLTAIRQVRPPRGSRLIGRLLSAWLSLVLPLIRLVDRRLGLE